MDILNDPDALKKILESLKRKRNEELINQRYAGACYEILVDCQAIAVVAADIEDNAISNVALAYVNNGRLFEHVLKKRDVVDLILNHPEYPIGTPNIFDSPTRVRVVDNTYLRSDANNTRVDNLEHLPSISSWQNSQARKILRQLVKSHFSSLS